MNSSFKILRILSVALKGYAFLTLLLMVIALVGLFMANGVLGQQKFQMIMNTVLGGTLFFLVLFSLGELIRLILQIEMQTRKENL